jgi:hypothetical protein
MTNIKKQIEETEKKLNELKQKLEGESNKQEWIPFTFEGKDYEVQKNLSEPVEAKDLIIPTGCKLMNVLQAGYIHAHIPEVKLSSDWEWIEQFSDKNKELGYSFAVVGLGSDRYESGVRLLVSGDYWNDSSDGCASGVRFIREVENESK